MNAPGAAALKGRLVLVPNALDHGSPEDVALDLVLPSGVIRRAAALEHWLVESPKAARAFLKRVHAVAPLRVPLQSLTMQALPVAPKGAGGRGLATSPTVPEALLAPALLGHDVGLLSDAGLPGVADPGALVVAAAHRLGLVVDVLAGPSSITLALAASGLNGQSFAFVGYLPQQDPERSARLRALEGTSRREKQTQVAIETPYRNEALAQALLQTLAPDTWLGVACGLTMPGGYARTHRVAAWRANPPAFGAHLPAVFSWLAT